MHNQKLYPGEVRRWNKTLAECYQRGCICEGCQVYEMYFKHNGYKCRCKGYVIEAIRRFGVPESIKRKNEIINDYGV